MQPLSRRMRRLSIVGDPTWESWWRGFKATTRHASHPRFSADKARKFITYKATTSTFHQAMVLLLFPVPGLLEALIAPLVPLQDPSDGLLQNHGYITHGLITIALNMTGAMIASYSALFQLSNDWQQLLLIALFPLVKTVLKRLVFAVSHHLSDYARETAISGVEISASMYQAMVMQSTPTLLATALVIGFDLVQGFVDVMLLMERTTIIPRRDLLDTAIQIPLSNNQASVKSPLQLMPTAVHQASVHPMDHGNGTSTTVSPQARSSNKAILTQALELLQSAETILLIEYIEVAVPTTNAVFLCIASQLQSATFNPQLRMFHGDYAALGAAIAILMLYTSLQAVTLLMMCLVMRIRYRVSAFTLLAFVLEHHAWSLHGKMIAWLTSILEFSVIHYGVDFTFKFDLKLDK